MRALRTARTLGALLTALVLASCGKPGAGDRCRKGKSLCSDKAHALVCRGEIYETVDCTAEPGCHKLGDELICEQIGGEEGRICTKEDRRTCSFDKKRVLVCRGGRFQKALDCRGAAGCEQSGPAKITCDQALAFAGEPCQGPGFPREDSPEDTTYACTGEGASVATLLRCRMGRWETYHFCRGPKGCKLQAPTIPVCDGSIAEVNDPCEPAGRIACSPDQSHELMCQGSSFMTGRKCPRGCRLMGAANTIRCD